MGGAPFCVSLRCFLYAQFCRFNYNSLVFYFDKIGHPHWINDLSKSISFKGISMKITNAIRVIAKKLFR